MTEIDWTKAETTRGGFPPSDARNMTLRDEFAKAVMQGLVTKYGYEADALSFKDTADHAYRLADAMLAERAKRTK